VILGHALLSFSFVSLLMLYMGRNRREIIAWGISAAFFASLPDVDVLPTYAVAIGSAETMKWSIITKEIGVHRTITHSILTGVAVVSMCFLSKKSRISYLLVPSLFLLFIGWNLSLVELISTSILFLLSIAFLELTREEIQSPLPALLILTHPFLDVFSGEIHLLYPLSDLTLSVSLSENPVMEFFVLLGLELAAIWIFVLSLNLIGVLRIERDWSGFLGSGYAGIAALIPFPTKDSPEIFVISLILFSAAITLLRLRKQRGIVLALQIITVAYFSSMAYFIFRGVIP